METSDGELLRSLFGYYPTLHDARIRALAFDMSARSATMVVDYEDLIESTDRNHLDVRIRLEWSGVRKCSFPFAETYVLEMNLKRVGKLVRTELLIGGTEWMTIESEAFEARLERVGPERGVEDVAMVTIQ